MKKFLIIIIAVFISSSVFASDALYFEDEYYIEELDVSLELDAKLKNDGFFFNISFSPGTATPTELYNLISRNDLSNPFVYLKLLGSDGELLDYYVIHFSQFYDIQTIEDGRVVYAHIANFAINPLIADKLASIELDYLSDGKDYRTKISDITVPEDFRGYWLANHHNGYIVFTADDIIIDEQSLIQAIKEIVASGEIVVSLSEENEQDRYMLSVRLVSGRGTLYFTYLFLLDGDELTFLLNENGQEKSIQLRRVF